MSGGMINCRSSDAAVGCRQIDVSTSRVHTPGGTRVNRNATSSVGNENVLRLLSHLTWWRRLQSAQRLFVPIVPVSVVESVIVAPTMSAVPSANPARDVAAPCGSNSNAFMPAFTAAEATATEASLVNLMLPLVVVAEVTFNVWPPVRVKVMFPATRCWTTLRP